MNFLSLFSGIGGFDWGLMQVGHTCVGYVEWDKYAHESFEILHDPEKKLWSGYDVRDVTDGSIRELGERTGGVIQLIAGGFPCQSFSIAGKRQGFADATRGTLFFEIIRFASILRPQYLLLENVQGLLNHDKGETFEIVLGALDELGYDVEWQVHNSSAYVPQNRERIFIIGHLRGLGTRKVFPFGRENTKAIDVIGRLEGKGDDYVRRVYGVGGLSPTLPTMQGGGQEPKILVAGQLDCDSGGTGKIYDPEGIAPTQLAQHGNAVTKVIVNNDKLEIGGEIATCLDANYHKGLDNHGQRTGVMISQKEIKFVETFGTLTAMGPSKGRGNYNFVPGVMLTDAGQGRKLQVRTDITPPLRAEGGGSTPGIWVTEPRAVLSPDRPEKQQNGRQIKEPGEPMFTLTAADKHGIQLGYRIRKLTPLECFRLQSYPDIWFVTLKLFRHPEYIPQIDMNSNDITQQVLAIITENGLKEGMSDSQLYKMAGNGVTSAVAADIASRLEEV